MRLIRERGSKDVFWIGLRVGLNGNGEVSIYIIMSKNLCLKAMQRRNTSSAQFFYFTEIYSVCIHRQEETEGINLCGDAQRHTT